MTTVISRPEIQRKLAENICAQLKRHNMSQGDLARELFGDEIATNERMRVSRWCNGRAFPDIADISNMAEVFGISIDTLVRGTIARRK